MPSLPSAFKASFAESKYAPSDFCDSPILSTDRFSYNQSDSLPDFDVIEEWIVDPDYSSMMAEDNPINVVVNPSSTNLGPSCGTGGYPFDGNGQRAVGSTISRSPENPVSRIEDSGKLVGIETHPCVENMVVQKTDLDSERADEIHVESNICVGNPVVKKPDLDSDTPDQIQLECHLCVVIPAVKNKDLSSEREDRIQVEPHLCQPVVKELALVSEGAVDIEGSLVRMTIQDGDDLNGSSVGEVKEDVHTVKVDGDREDDLAGREFNGSLLLSSSSCKEDEDSLSSSSSSFMEYGDEAEVEEGEIKDSKEETLFGGSEDEGEETMKGPIRSKNETVPDDLPPVPAVNIVLESQHITSPVGAVLSVMDNRVIVDGSEKHNPLTESSILWLTDTRLPLGFVDEIFGPVKNPYYVVRFNSIEEIPQGVQQGTTVSFVPEFVNFVLNEKEIYKKGYDASGDNDEEIVDEFEFSDDEKEAEFKKSLQQNIKRQNDNKNGKQQPFSGNKKVHHKGGFTNKTTPANSTARQGSEPQTSLRIPLILDAEHLANPTSQFFQKNPLPKENSPSCPLPSSHVYPPNSLAYQQMPTASNNLVSAGSCIPAAQPFGRTGQVANTFGLLNSAQGVQQPGYSGNPPHNFVQQPNTVWTSIPSCPGPPQQPVFAGVHSGLWNLPSVDQLQLGLLGNPSQGVQNFVFSAGLQQPQVAQVPGCTTWQGPNYPVGLNGLVPFPGNNTQLNPVGTINAEQGRHLNANQCIGKFVLGVGNGFPTQQQFNQGTAPDSDRRLPDVANTFPALQLSQGTAPNNFFLSGIGNGLPAPQQFNQRTAPDNVRRHPPGWEILPGERESGHSLGSLSLSLSHTHTHTQGSRLYMSLPSLNP